MIEIIIVGAVVIMSVWTLLTFVGKVLEILTVEIDRCKTCGTTIVRKTCRVCERVGD